MISQDKKKKFSLEEMQQQMELQLHEQYAINNNAYLKSIIALFIGLFAAIGFYGYVVIHSEPIVNIMKCSYEVYNINQLTFTAVGCLVVLAIMIHICIYQGTAQRYEQFIIYAIRKKYYIDSTMDKIFPKTYTPFNKCGLSIIQGLYGEFIKIIFGVEILILWSYHYMYHNIILCDKTCTPNPNIEDLCQIVLGAFGVLLLLNIFAFCCRRSKYIDLTESYHNLNN